MKYKWTTRKFSDIAEFNPIEYLAKGAFVIKVTMDKLKPYCRDIPSCEMAAFNGGSKFRNGDTIMARITPCLENGKIAKVNILGENKVGFGSTEFLVVRAKQNIADQDFIYYLITSHEIRDLAIKSMVGSSGRQRVQANVVKNHKISIPSLIEQKIIGRFLKSLDDKIELNEMINKNLEEQAQALFEDFFLHRDCLPVGWKQGSLLDIADYINGLAMQKFRPLSDESGIPVLKIKELRKGMCDLSSELCTPNIKPEYIVSDGDVIFSWSGSLLVDFWCGGICGLNQHLFKVTSLKYDKWFYYAWTKHHLAKFTALASAMATTMGHIKRSELANANVLIPNGSDYKYIGQILQPIYDLIIVNRIENMRLSNLRDELLPKLMSGELNVSEVEI